MAAAKPVPLDKLIQAVYSRQLFFVAGAPKSGTTWLQRLLDAHPAVRCMGEGHFAERLIQPLEALFAEYNKHMGIVAERVYEGKPYYHGLNDSHLQVAVQVLVASMLMQRGLPKELRCIGDKTPRYNFGLDALLRFFPKAKFLHIVRDGRDVVVSVLHHTRRAGYTEVLKPGSDQHVLQVKRGAAAWRQNVAAWRKFAGAHRDICLQVSYEQLHEAPEACLESAFRFLGVNADASIVQQCIEEASFKKLSGREPGQEEKTSFFRKGIVGDWKNHLDVADTAIFMREAGALLKSLGYPV